MLSLIGAVRADQGRELDYAAVLQQMPLPAKIVTLTADGQSFVGLYTETGKPEDENAVIVLHDMGGYPDQKLVVHELRTQLSQHNWSTLALQMPLREISADEADYYPLFDDAKSRIAAGMEYLKQAGVKNIAIVGYGMGALMAAYAVSEDVKSFVAMAAISLPVPESTEPKVQAEKFLKAISLPVLDIYAEFDLPDVVLSAKKRRLAAKQNPLYRQERLDGENHAYQQDYERLVKRVYSWLSSSTRQSQ